MLVSACGGPDAEGTIETEDGTITYEADSDGTEVSFSASNDNGEVMQINSGGGVEVDLPDGYTLFPGASVVTNMNMVRNDMNIANIIFNSTAQPAQVAEFYRDQAVAAGIEINNEATINGAVIFSGVGEGDTTFNISASPSEGGSSAQLSLSTPR